MLAPNARRRVAVASRHRIGILGGTGPLGRGLAARLASTGHTVLLGSRARERATQAVDELRVDIGHDVLLEPAVNEEAIEGATLVVVAMPYEGQTPTLKSLEPPSGALVVNVVNPLGFDDQGPYMLDVPGSSAAEECQAIWPDTHVVAAFKETPASVLQAVRDPLDCDVLVAGDDDDAVASVIALVDDLPGARGLACGPLRTARYLETLTPILIGVNRRYRAHAGIRLTGVETGES
jgi:8-hydroxy-5-deazaflavin:NADPH oxidoreductase